jgi:ATP-dependent 26S proteasome regulatory subunit
MLYYSEVSGDREVQRTMLELLNQLDGFSSDERIKVRVKFSKYYLLDDLAQIVFNCKISRHKMLMLITI